MDIIVIEDYYYMMIMDEVVNWMKLAHVLSVSSLHLMSLLYIYIYFNIISSLFKCTH